MQRILNNRLKYLLLDHNLKQSDLAIRVGLSRTSITLFANGGTVPSIINALLIAEALGVSVHDIWALSDPADT